ncbi:unnamed protein product [Caretta caretta]
MASGAWVPGGHVGKRRRPPLSLDFPFFIPLLARFCPGRACNNLQPGAGGRWPVGAILPEAVQAPKHNSSPLCAVCIILQLGLYASHFKEVLGTHFH